MVIHYFAYGYWHASALDENTLVAAEFVLQEAYAEQIRESRGQLACVEYGNAWVAGQLLTLSEARRHGSLSCPS